MLAADPFGPVHIRLWLFVNLSSNHSECVKVHCPAEGGCCCQGVPFPLGLGMLDLQYCYSAGKPGLSVKKEIQCSGTKRPAVLFLIELKRTF